jgi:catechol 2,3-dioxygenase-like lactoylglutathione lyase family enzyme
MATVLEASEVTRKPELPSTAHFHLGLLVTDLDKSITFYRALFGCEPTRTFAGDYAEFELADPPLLLALTQCPNRTPGGALNHVGLRYATEAAVDEVARRLEAAGQETRHEKGVACCYARQTKCWATDPDHNLWEVYVLFDDLDYNGYGGKPAPAIEPEAAATSVWEHKLGEAMPNPASFSAGSVDEARLTGTFNDTLSIQEVIALLAEARRVLSPGGKVVAQGLVSKEPFPGKPDLPGLASKVRSIPLEHEPLDALKSAGFTDLYYDMNGDIKCFSVNGVEFRKIRLIGRNPGAESTARHAVVYKGPMRQVTGDDGTMFPRGESVSVSQAAWEALRHGPAATQFVFLGS